MKSRGINIALVCLLLGTAAKAVEIRGSRSCGVWMEHRATSPRGIGVIAAESWLVGYLSGKANSLGKDFLKDTDNESLFAWTDNYCKTSPLDRIDNAGDELSKELIRRKRL